MGEARRPRAGRGGGPALGPFLEEVYGRFADRRYLASDPLSAPHRYERPEDREVVAFLAAGLAFGNVTSILAAVDRALAPLGERPADALRAAGPRDVAAWARGFNHRWIFADDLANAYAMLGGALREAGGLEPLFAAGMAPGAPDVRPGAFALVEGLRRQLPAAAAARRGTRSFLPDAAGPSACKRLHMFLRWVVRDRDVDLGLWTSARPDQLLVPVDTHVGRLARYLGLTCRETLGRAAVEDITRGLRAVDPADPVRFDFGLSRLGILRHCPRRRDPARCAGCQLLPVCRL